MFRDPIAFRIFFSETIGLVIGDGSAVHEKIWVTARVTTLETTKTA